MLPRTKFRCLLVCFQRPFFAAALSAAITVLVTGQVLAQSNDPLTFNWNEYGKQVAAGMPRSVRSPLDRVKFIADAVGSKIRQQGISPKLTPAWSEWVA